MGEMEEHGWVLDFMPSGKATDREREPVAQLVGSRYFTLLEVASKPDVTLTIGQKVYIGKDNRDAIERIKRRIEFSELTGSSRSELKHVLRKAIEDREADFVTFFNKAGPVSIRLHQLELLPGVGKKHMEELLDQRERKPFESMADLRARIPLLPDPMNLLVQRIEAELQGNEKYYLFVKPPFVKRQ